MNIGAALLQGAEMLECGRVPDPRFTAEILLRQALHCDRAWLFAHSQDELPRRAWIHYGRFLNERLKGKPTQQITGVQEFYGRTFRVNPHVLIPRPETEHLVETALAYLGERPLAVLDVGTGSGAIAITLSLESQARVFASDISLDALPIAERNAQWLAAKVAFFAADLLTAVRPGSIDLIVSNPPYIAETDAPALQPEVRDWEPWQALFAGPSGNEVYSELLDQAAHLLRPGGRIMLELGYNSLAPVRNLLIPSWVELGVVEDLAGWPRVLTARVA